VLPEKWRQHVAKGLAILVGQSIADVSKLSESDEGWDPCGTDQRLVITLGLKGKEESHDVQLSSEKSCKAFMVELADASPQRLVGARDYRVAIAAGRVRHKSRAIYDVADTFCGGFEEGACAGDYEERHTTLITLVGPVLTLSEEWGQRNGGGPPYHGALWKTVDLRTGKPAKLLDFVDEASLVAAIAKHKSLAEEDPERSKRLATAKTWADALAILTLESERRALQSFAFVERDTKNGRVGLSLGFEVFQGFGSYTVESLDVSVNPTKLLQPYLEASQSPVFLQTPGLSIGVGTPPEDPTDP